MRSALCSTVNEITLEPDLINTHVAVCNQILTAMLQRVVETLPRRVDSVTTAKCEGTPC